MSGQNDPKVALRVRRHVDSFPQLALCQLFNWRFGWPRRIFLVSPKQPLICTFYTREIYNPRRARPRGQYRRWRNYSRAPIHGLPRRLRIYHLAHSQKKTPKLHIRGCLPGRDIRWHTWSAKNTRDAHLGTKRIMVIRVMAGPFMGYSPLLQVCKGVQHWRWL